MNLFTISNKESLNKKVVNERCDRSWKSDFGLFAKVPTCNEVNQLNCTYQAESGTKPQCASNVADDISEFVEFRSFKLDYWGIFEKYVHQWFYKDSRFMN